MASRSNPHFLSGTASPRIRNEPAGRVIRAAIRPAPVHSHKRRPFGSSHLVKPLTTQLPYGWVRSPASGIRLAGRVLSRRAVALDRKVCFYTGTAGTQKELIPWFRLMFLPRLRWEDSLLTLHAHRFKLATPSTPAVRVRRTASSRFSSLAGFPSISS